jgi:molybdopterin-guanine dinucleotide biosynthesis protein A
MRPQIIAPDLGVVLAGGKSSRMGQNKALMRYKNLRLVDHAVKLLENSGVKKVIVSGEIDGYENVKDQVKNLGPIGGIISVILKEKKSEMVFVPVDTPLLTPELIRKLFENKNNFDAIFFEKNPLPLFLKISDQVLALTKKILAAKKPVAIHQFLAALNSQQIFLSEKNSKFFANINTLEDYFSLPSSLLITPPPHSCHPAF